MVNNFTSFESMRRQFIYVILSVICLLFVSCFSNTNHQNKASAISYHLPYNFDQPDLSYKLPKKLKEVSAICQVAPDEFACVQDEKGAIFLFNTTKNEITRTIKFGKKGDYEGLSIVNSTAYVLENNGNIYEIEDYSKKVSTTIKHKSFLTAGFDAEGLTHDPENNRLLIACKGRGSKKQKIENQRQVFAFNLDTKELEKKSVYSISNEDVLAYFKNTNEPAILSELEKFMKDHKTKMVFNPSELFIHPQTKELFLLSAFPKLLGILDMKSGKLLHLQPLAPTIHTQPEGLFIDTDGDVWISNEGKEEEAQIHLFHKK